MICISAPFSNCSWLQYCSRSVSSQALSPFLFGETWSTGPCLKIIFFSRRGGAWPPSLGIVSALLWAILLPGRAVISPGLGNGTTGTCPGHTHWLTHPAGSLICRSGGEQGSKVPALSAGKSVPVAARRILAMVTWNPVLFGQSEQLSSALAHLDRIQHSGQKRTQQLKLAQRRLSRLQKKHVAFQMSCSPKQNQQFWHAVSNKQWALSACLEEMIIPGVWMMKC